MPVTYSNNVVENVTQFKRRKFCNRTCASNSNNIEQAIKKEKNGKTCSKCGETKPVDLFYKRKGKLGAFSDTCKECTKLVIKSSRLKRFFNITLEEHTRVLEGQEKKCAICKRPLTLPNLDHSHSTGETRGFLCFRCNKGLAMFSDNPNWLELAAQYLREPPVLRVLGRRVFGLPGGVGASMAYRNKLKKKLEFVPERDQEKTH